MKQKSESKTIKTAKGFAWGGAVFIISAILAFVLDAVDMLPLSEAVLSWVKFIGGAGLAAAGAAKTFYELRLVTVEAVQKDR